MLTRYILAVVLVMALLGMVVERTVQSAEIRSIAQIKSADTVGGTVVIKGRVSMLSGNTFHLQDGSGTAKLWTCPTWYKRISMKEGDQITVVGQVVRDEESEHRSDIVLSVYKIIDGREVIHVREYPGKPRWGYAKADSSESGNGLGAL